MIGIDNVLARLADPFMIGYTSHSKTPLTCKYVRKRDASEKVSVILKKAGKPFVIGYSELSENQR